MTRRRTSSGSERPATTPLGIRTLHNWSWQTEVSSSIYATPLISDFNSDGKLESVGPSFVHYKFWKVSTEQTPRDNLQLLRQQYYYATWKVDGMIHVNNHGWMFLD